MQWWERAHWAVLLSAAFCARAAAQPPVVSKEAVGGIPTADPNRPWVDVAYPQSNVIAGIEFNFATRRQDAFGSDIWPITWADDGHQYSAFGDGAGFGVASAKEQNGKSRVSLGVSRIEGDAGNYVGKNVWGGKAAENPAQFEGKGTGILCVEGTLYMWVAGPASATVPITQLAVSRDHSRTWKLADWNFTMQDRLFAGVFLNFGHDYAGARDDYVYSYFTHIDNPPPQTEMRRWVHETPGRVDLARAPKDRLLDRTAWEWLAGVDEAGGARWTPEMTERVAAFEDPNGIKVVSACHHDQLDRYLLLYNPRDNRGHFACFEAPAPWGPWHKVAYLREVPTFMPPEPNYRVSLFHFAPKWWSADGKEFTLIFNTGDDAWNTLRGRLVLTHGDGTRRR